MDEKLFTEIPPALPLGEATRGPEPAPLTGAGAQINPSLRRNPLTSWLFQLKPAWAIPCCQL